jgi:acetylglutamate kinase
MAVSIQEYMAARAAPLADVAHPTCVVKIGGSTLDDAACVLDGLADLWRACGPLVVVHGGGPIIDAWLRRLGIAPRFVAGRRVTDVATLEVVRAVMGGAINGDLVAALVARGVPALGLIGAAAGLLHADRAAPEHGLVGIAPHATDTPLRVLLAGGFVPVIAPLAIGPDGECLNVNADDAATAIARALGADHLLFVSDVPGVLDAAGHIIARLTASQAADLLADGTIITGGMIPKLQACLAALDAIRAIHIVDAPAASDLRAITAGERTIGTQIVAE